MADVVKMPLLSDTMEEGTINKWHKKVGDTVKSGEILADIDTDKATMEFESFYDGTVLYQGVKEGEAAPVDTIIAVIGKKGEDYKSLIAEAKPKKVAEESKQVEAKTETEETSSVKIDTSNIDAQVVRMPLLSDTMEEGTINKWHKKVGDNVKSGEILADIDTDKATMEFESFYDGTVLYQGVEEGKSAPVDAVIAIIGDKKADYKTLLKAEQRAGGKKKDDSTPVPKEEVKTAPAAVTQTQPLEKVNGSAKASTSSVMSNGNVKASPLAKKMAEEKGINLASVQGTGPDGRIIKRDIENYKSSALAPNVSLVESYTEEPVSQMRKTIARRLTESKFQAPHFYLTINIDMDNAIAARKAINEVAATKISFNDLVIKAVTSALHKHPKVNASWLGDKLRYYKHIHIGVAVAVEDGLLVPVIRFADSKTLTQINGEVKAFAEKARNRKLQPEEMQGNTFTISNLGMYGIEEFTAIINPPDACILAVGGIQQVPVVKNGEIVPGNRMKVTLSCDHRVVDGATGSEFLKTLKQYLENPVLLLGEGSI